MFLCSKWNTLDSEFSSFTSLTVNPSKGWLSNAATSCFMGKKSKQDKIKACKTYWGMHLDFTHAPYHCNRLYSKQVVTNSHAQNAAFYSLHAWIRGQERTKPCRLQHRCSSFYCPDNIYLVFHCTISSFCLVRTYIKRSSTTWQQTKSPSSPVLSPTTLAVSFHVLKVIWDAISGTE